MQLIPILIFFLACASSPDYESDTPPNWLADAHQYCGEKYLCAVGEAKNLQLSDARARGELAKIFETEITTELKASETFQTGAAVKENYFSEIMESSETHLKNVKILAHWKRAESAEIFSLAGLDREALRSELQQQLGPLRAQLKGLVASGKRSDLIRAKKIYPRMKPFLTQWSIVSDSEYHYTPKEEDFQAHVMKRFQRPVEIRFDWQGDPELRQTMEGYIKDLLVKSGYKLGPSVKKYIIKGRLHQRDLPIKLSGYQKKEFELGVDVYRRDKLVGSLHHHFKTSGKNWGQLVERARITFMKEIFENLENLNIN